MNEAGCPVVSLADHPVWNALLSYKIGSADAAFPFSARLARDNGWTVAMAERVISEYKRFCFLAVTVDRPVTPSDAVDQAWHLHLTYTRDYWEWFCPQVLRRPLHHGPTAGGAAEQHKYFEQYAQTLASYEAVFGAQPPSDLWPNAARRLQDDPKARRVHPRDAWIVAKRPASLIMAGLLIACVGVWFLIKGG